MTLKGMTVSKCFKKAVAGALALGLTVGLIATPAEAEGVKAHSVRELTNIVDQNAEILADILELEEIISARARNGEEAVQMFSKSEKGFYSAILMDVRMPVMDGLDATKTIRALVHPDAKTIPIIAMTANVFDEDVERSIEAGMDAHLFKPVEPDVLYETMTRLIVERTSKEVD